MANQHSVTLNWNVDAGATSYNVYRGLTAGGEGTTPYATGLTVTTFTDNAVTGGTTYFYYVTAVGTGGESAGSAEVSAQIPIPPNPPTGLSVTVH
jgi:fibronectin type 3 domain-containing protein